MKRRIITLAVILIVCNCWSEVLSSSITDIAKLKPLMGTWDFTYSVTWVDTGISESFTRTYTLNNIYKYDGKYYIEGIDHTFGTDVTAHYDEVEGSYDMSDTGGIEFFYVFNFTEANTVAGTYHPRVPGGFIDISFPFTGIKVGEVRLDFCPASTIYGTDSAETELLRSLRDNVLSKSPEGRELIKLYYQWSPLIVRAMGADEEFKKDVNELFDEILELIGE